MLILLPILDIKTPTGTTNVQKYLKIALKPFGLLKMHVRNAYRKVAWMKMVVNMNMGRVLISRFSSYQYNFLTLKIEI